MKRTLILAALLATMPAPALAAGNAGMVLGKLPPMPHDADSAYGQWDDNDGNLTKGPDLLNYEKTVNAVGGAMIMAMQHSGATTVGATAVSPHDQAVLQGLQPYAGATVLQARMAQASADIANLRRQFRAEIESLGPQEAAESTAVPVCAGEEGIPEPSAAAAVAQKYASKRVAIASSYLGREAVIINAVRQMIGGEASYADRAYAGWSSLSGGMMKSASYPTVIGMETSALGDVGVVLGYIEDASRDAAEMVAKRNRLNHAAGQAHGCN